MWKEYNQKNHQGPNNHAPTVTPALNSKLNQPTPWPDHLPGHLLEGFSCNSQSNLLYLIQGWDPFGPLGDSK